MPTTPKLSEDGRRQRLERLRYRIEAVEAARDRGQATDADVSAARERLRAALLAGPNAGDASATLYAPDRGAPLTHDATGINHIHDQWT